MKSSPPQAVEIGVGAERWALGIDIGYSPDKSTLGLASATDVFTAYGLSPRKYGASNGQVLRVECRLEDAVAWIRRVPGEMRRAVVATIDGPIAPHGPPREQRFVDRACQGGLCQYRCPPSSVVGGGKDLVDATYRFLDALGSAPRILMSPNIPSGAGPFVAEVNPTLGLAWLIGRVEEWRSLPSRNRRKRGLPPVVVNERIVRAKSEYYWEMGGNRIVAAALQAPDVATLRHHEAEASLYALSVALALVGNVPPGVTSICLGREDGVFHLLGPIDPSWSDERERIGHVALV